jgi:hypothetical protein
MDVATSVLVEPSVSRRRVLTRKRRSIGVRAALFAQPCSSHFCQHGAEYGRF